MSNRAVREFRAAARARRQFATGSDSPADCGPAREVPDLTPTLLWIAILALPALVAGLLLRHRAGQRRHRVAMAGVLDAADALETRLRTARSEIEAVAGEGDDPVRAALQEMLRQRLWLQQHGSAASPDQLDAVRVSINDARARIDQQLLHIERARAPQP